MKARGAKRFAAVLAVVATAAICGMFAWSASTAPPGGSAPLDPAEGLPGASEQANNPSAHFEQASAEALADVLHVQNAGGARVALADVPEEDYRGFLFKLASSASGAGSVSAKVEAALADGLIRQVHDDVYATDSLDILSGLFDADQLEYVEPNYRLHLTEQLTADLGQSSAAAGMVDVLGGTSANPAPDWPPNDQSYSGGKLWNLDMLNVEGAWEAGLDGDVYVYNGKPVRADEDGNAIPVKVAIIDTGLFGTGFDDTVQHEDLNYENIVPGYNFIAGTEGNAPDAHGHGTFVAGLIAAQVNNSKGVAGAMPNVTLVPEKVFDTGSASTEDVISAIYHATDTMGVDVINMSLGGEYNEYSLEAACDHAVDEGVLVVASAGNDGVSTPNYPAAYDSVVGVASVNSNKVRSTWSQFGRSVFVTAPGESVTSTFKDGADSYYTASGTSFSGPEVAALAAMCKSVYPDIDQDTFKQLLIDTSEDLGAVGYDDYYGYGLVDFAAMAQAVLQSQVLPWYDISFNLSDEQGHVISNASIKLTAAETITWEASEEDVEPAFEAGSLVEGEAVQPGEDGTFKLHRGSYSYEIVSDGFYTVTGTLKTYTEHQSLNLVMLDAYETSVNVVDSAGQPVSEFTLAVSSDRTEQPKSISGSTSVYDLASGVYSYAAKAQGYEDAGGSFTVQREPKEIDAVLYRADELRTVRFTCQDAGDARELTTGLSVAVYDTSGVTVAVREDGTYRLAAGKDYTVRVSKVGYEDGVATFTVGDDADQTVIVSLTAATNVYTFNVVNEDGKAVSTAVAKVADSNGALAEPRADNSLRFNLTQGSYTYEVSAPGYESKTGSFEVATESRTLTVTLVAVPHSVAFSVTDASTGDTIEDASIKVSTDKALRSLPAETNGTWLLTPGGYRYTVYKEGYGIAKGTFTVAGEDVVLEVALQVKAESDVAYAGGSGTQDDPYLIATEEQLRYLASQTEIVRMTNSQAETNKKIDVGGYYQLVDDIELTGGEWLPIGNMESSSNYARFTGVFDGAGHTVSGVYVDQPDCDYQGFFGYACGATIANLIVEGSVSARSYVGGIVGGVSFSHSSLYESMNTDPTYIEQCGSRVVVSGRYATGGIVGSAQASDHDIDGTYYDPGTAQGITITDCFNSGRISSMVNGEYTRNASTAGGIVGSAQEVVISNCYNTASVQAGYNAGGLVGNARVCDVSTSYNTGLVAQYATGTGYGGTAGGLLGSSYYNVVSNGYYLPQDGTTATTYYGNTDTASQFKDCAAKEHAEMYRATAFVDALNTNTTTGAVSSAFVLGRDYPLLSWQVAEGALLAPAPHVIVHPIGVEACDSYKVGTEATPLVAEVDPVDQGTLTWVWYAGSDADGADAEPVLGASGTGVQASLVPSTDEASLGVRYYYCVFTNSVSTENASDEASASTNVATIYVRSLVDAQTPVISKLNPSQTSNVNTSLVTKAGADLELSVEASVDDGGTLTYQWYQSSTGQGSGKAIAGATSSTFDADTSSVATLYYYVEVTNTTEPGNLASVKSNWITVTVNEYTIEDYSDLAAFRAAVNGGTSFEGQIVYLEADIQIPDGVEWTPIGTVEHPFSGTFKGGTGEAGSEPSSITTHKITGLAIDGDAHDNANLGLFGFTQGASIYDVQVGGSITGAENTRTGLLVGYAAASSTSSYIENCSTLPGSSVEGKYEIGGLVGGAGARMLCVANHADVHAHAYVPTTADKAITTQGVKAVGGVVGYESSNVVGCAYNTGKVTLDARGDGDGTVCASHAGGVAGFIGYYGGIASAFNAGELSVGSLSENPVLDSSSTLYAGSVAGYVSGGLVNLHYQEGSFERGTNNASSYDYADYHSKQFMKTAYFANMMNTGSSSYATTQFTKSTSGVPHLIWEDDINDEDTDIRSAEPWIVDVQSEDLPNITSTWSGTYYQDGFARPIYVYADSPDGGALTYVWQKRVVVEGDDARDDDEGWEDIDGSTGTIGEDGRAAYTIDVSQPHEAQYRCLVTNTRADATADDPENPMQMTIPAITIEVKDKSCGLYLRAMDQENSKDNPWVIDSATRLQTFASLVSGSISMPGLDDNCFTGQYVALDADIDLTDVAWTPIGSYDSATHGGEFKGVFDGQNHLISGLSIDLSSGEVAQGLFASVYMAEICNLEVAGNVSVEGTSWMTGGVCGYAYGSYFHNVASRVNVSGYERVGGICANAGACVFRDCENTGSVSVNESAKASTYGGTMVGGIVGYTWGGAASEQGAGLYSCFNAGQVTGRVTDGEHRFGAIAGELGSSGGGITLSHNYYVAGSISSDNEATVALTGVGAKAAEPLEDAEGQCEPIEGVNSPATAWKLATSGGAHENSALWGNYSRESLGDDDSTVHLVLGASERAVYQLDCTNVAADITVSSEYTTAGTQIDVTWENKPGFTVKSVGYALAGADDATTLGTGDSGEGSFTMPAGDVGFAVDYEQDTTYRYLLVGAMQYDGATAPESAGSITLKPSSNGNGAHAGDTVTVKLAVGEGYQLRSVHADGAFGTRVSLEMQDALTYRFEMPAENVTVTAVLEDEGTPAAKQASSLEVTRAAVHRYATDSQYKTADLLFGTITLSGTYFGVHDPVMTYEIEGCTTPPLYEQAYRVDGVDHVYTGTDLAKLIRQYGGEDIAADTAVRIEAANGDYVECAYGDLTELDYNRYDDTNQPVVRGLPVLLAYGCDGLPNTDGAVSLVFGQKSSDDDNGSKMLSHVTRICVGDDVNSSQHVWGVYSDMDLICGGTANATQGQSDLHVRVYKGNELAGETIVSLNKIEQLANQDRKRIQHGYYSVAIYENDDKTYSGPYTDFYEGYDLYNLLSLCGIPYEPEASVQFYQSGMNGLENSWKTVNVSLGYLAGNGEKGEGDYSGNTMSYAGDGYVSSGTLTGLKPIIAYGKNSYPLVWSSGTAGVNSYAYNYRGPLIAILPQNEAEGGSYVGENTVASCYLGLVEVRLSQDADYTPVETIADEGDLEAAQHVLDLIAALPDVIATSDDKKLVDAAQKAYEELGAEAKRIVDADEDAIAKLKDAIEQAAALDEGESASGGSEKNLVVNGAGADSVKVGQRVIVGKGANKAEYEVLSVASASGPGTVAYRKAKKAKAKKVVVPASVTIKGKQYNVVSIEKKAFCKMKKLKKVTVGANVAKIKKSAFFKTPKLKKLVVKSKLFTSKKTVKAALKSSKAKKLTVKVPKSKKNAYKKIFTKKNLKAPRKVKIK